MNQTEIRAALAEQEEHIKRNRGCNGQPLAPHYWSWYSARPGREFRYEACGQCKVTRTPADYKRLMRARAAQA